MTELEKLKKQRDEIQKRISKLEKEEIRIGRAHLCRNIQPHQGEWWKVRVLTNLWGCPDKDRMQTIVCSPNIPDAIDMVTTIMHDLASLVKEMEKKVE